MNPYQVLAEIAAAYVLTLQQEVQELRRQVADLQAKIGPQAVPPTAEVKQDA